LPRRSKKQTSDFAGEQFEKVKKVGEHAYDTAKREADHQGLTGEAVANEAASKLNDTSIVPSGEDTGRDETGENKPEPVHERH
jgi:hypothetical protein